MTRNALIVFFVFIGAVTVVAAAAGSPVNAGVRAFYLAAKPGQCLIANSNSGNAGHKAVLVVSCSSPSHTFEVYAVRHGTWAKGTSPARGLVESLCLAAYRQTTGRSLAAPGGWYAFTPDPGAEQNRYGDKVICSYTHYPGLTPLGPGRHLH
jgi:hypothetical protein